MKHYLRIDEPINYVGLQHSNSFHRKYRLVIALHDTKLTSLRDIVDDIKVAHCTLHCSKRYRATQVLIDNILKIFQERYNGVAATSEVCITGHSLGAAIALFIGKDLAKDVNRRYYVHCFNPPFLSVLMLIQKFTLYDKVKNRLKGSQLFALFLHVGSVTKHVGKLGLAFIFGDRAKLLEEFYHFRSLTEWKPMLYVNKKDGICKEYQRFFKWKHGCNLVLPIHMQTLLSRIVQRNAKYSCLVPSVDMLISLRENDCHKLKQWYTDPSLNTKFQEFRLLGDVSSSNDIFHLEYVIGSLINNVVALLDESHPGGHTTAARSLLLHQTAKESLGFPATLHEQPVPLDADFDHDDEEIPPDSAEAVVLELELHSAQPMYT